MAGLVPLKVTASLQQGIVLDPLYGVSLDGILAGQVRASSAVSEGLCGAPSLLDGGLSGSEVISWDLPLQQCGEGQDWHWVATTGLLVDRVGVPVPLIPDTHRLLGEVDEIRARQIAISLPKNLGGARGRYRRRVTPVISVPAAAIVWHAVGDLDEIEKLLTPLTSIGSRRASGEGAVISWSVEEVSSVLDTWVFGHSHPNGEPGRLLPLSCAVRLGLELSQTVVAGIRPPMFHKETQRTLVVPS